MAGKVRHLLNRDGRYFARLVVPVELRALMDGKTELRTPLGGDRRDALRKLPGEVAKLQHRIGLAEQQAIAATGRPSTTTRYPLNADQLANQHYAHGLAFDAEARMTDHRYASWGFVDDRLVDELRSGMAGALNDDELEALVGDRIERFRMRGNTDAAKGTPKWRELAMKLCVAEYEILGRIAERDEGDFTGKPEHPLIANPAPVEDETPKASLTFDRIIDDEVARRARGRDAKPLPARTVKKYRDDAAAFAKWRKSKNAATVTAVEGKGWIEAMQESGGIGNRTVAAKFKNVRTVLNWGRAADPANFHPLGNPLTGVKIPDWTTAPSYLRAFTMDEAGTVLAAARKEMRPMLRWIPWLCAYSGMRVSEAAALRKEDFFKVGERWFWKVTTAGSRTLKTASSERRIPVHQALIDEGLIVFVEAAPAGRLFRGETKETVSIQPRVSEWVRGIIPMDSHSELSPNHGWRHLFEDMCRLADMQDDARNYITGRSTGKSQELYGRSEVMLPGLVIAMDKVTSIALS